MASYPLKIEIHSVAFSRKVQLLIALWQSCRTHLRENPCKLGCFSLRYPEKNAIQILSENSILSFNKNPDRIPRFHFMKKSPNNPTLQFNHCAYRSVWDRSQGLAICHQGAQKGAPPLTAFSLSGCGEGTTPPLDDSEWEEVSPGESGCFSAPDDQQLTACYGGGVVHFDCRCGTITRKRVQRSCVCILA